MIEEARRASQADDVMVGMEPSGIYWKPLFSFLVNLGYESVLFHSSAVLHNRKTYSDGAHKTDSKDAKCVGTWSGKASTSSRSREAPTRRSLTG